MNLQKTAMKTPITQNSLDIFKIWFGNFKNVFDYLCMLKPRLKSTKSTQNLFGIETKLLLKNISLNNVSVK